MQLILCAILSLIPLGCLSKPEQSLPGQAKMDQLYKSLFDDYEKDVIPVTEGGEAINVEFGIVPICFQLTPDGILKSEMWHRWSWHDPRMVAESVIPVIRVDPSKLWRPDVTLYNRADTWNPPFPDGSQQSKALVYTANGEVLWVPPVYQEARCVTDLDDFWGEQTCTLKFGSWTYDGSVIDPNFYKGDEKADLAEYSENCPVKVLSSVGEKRIKKFDCCEEPYVALYFNVTLQRQFVVTEHGILRNPRLSIQE